MPQELSTTTQRRPMAVPMQTRRPSPVADAILANVLRSAPPSAFIFAEVYDDNGRLLNWFGGHPAGMRRIVNS